MYRTDKNHNVLWHDAIYTDDRILTMNNADKTHDGHILVCGVFDESLRYRDLHLTNTGFSYMHFVMKIDSRNGDLIWYYTTKNNSGSIINSSAFSLPYARILFQYHKPDTLWGFPPIPPNNRQVLARLSSTGKPLDFSIVDYTYGFSEKIHVEPSGSFFIVADSLLVVKDTSIAGFPITTKDALLVKYDRWLRPQSVLTGNWKGDPSVALLDNNRGLMVAGCNGHSRFGSQTWDNPTGPNYVCIVPFYLPTTLTALPDSADTTATPNIGFAETEELMFGCVYSPIPPTIALWCLSLTPPPIKRWFL
jgi:hypothetical protein